MKITDFIPVLDWLPKYKRSFFRGDLIAGLTVGIMVIPQGMAYGMLAELPPIYGLYASLVPVFIYTLFGTSRHLIIGATAIESLLVGSGVAQFVTIGTPEFVSTVFLLTTMVGVIHILLGIFRLGYLTNFLSKPVLSGFTSALAIIIIFNQLKHLTGIDVGQTTFIPTIVKDLFQNISQTNSIALIIGMVGIFSLASFKAISKKIPDALIVLTVAIASVSYFNLGETGLKILGEIPQGLPAFQVPTFDLELMKQLLPLAFTIALISVLTTIANSKAILLQCKDYDIKPNQEMGALGMANLIGAFFQGYTVSGSFSRTFVNYENGAKTPLAGWVAVSIVALTLLFLTPLFYHLPKAILASIIIVAVFNLVDLKAAIKLWKTNRNDFCMLIVTFFATLLLGIQFGILIGVVLSLVMVLFKSTKPHIAELARIPGTNFYKNVNRFTDHIEDDVILIIRFDSPLYFANVNHFKDSLKEMVVAKGEKLNLIVINTSGIGDIDSTAMSMLFDLEQEFTAQKIQLFFSGMRGPVRDTFHKSNFYDKLGKDHFFLTVNDAVNSFENKEINNQANIVMESPFNEEEE